MPSIEDGFIFLLEFIFIYYCCRHYIDCFISFHLRHFIVSFSFIYIFAASIAITLSADADYARLLPLVSDWADITPGHLLIVFSEYHHQRPGIGHTAAYQPYTYTHTSLRHITSDTTILRRLSPPLYFRRYCRFQQAQAADAGDVQVRHYASPLLRHAAAILSSFAITEFVLLSDIIILPLRCILLLMLLIAFFRQFADCFRWCCWYADAILDVIYYWCHHYIIYCHCLRFSFIDARLFILLRWDIISAIADYAATLRHCHWCHYYDMSLPWD